MTPVLDIVVAILLVAGAFFIFTAALGLLRLPDLYTRMHAASKAGTVGSGILLVAAGLYAQDVAVFARALIGIGFFLMSAPVAAHLIARAARHTRFEKLRNSKLEKTDS